MIKDVKMATSWDNWGVKAVMENQPIGTLKRWTEDAGESKCVFWVASSHTCPSAWRGHFPCSRESCLHKGGGFGAREALAGLVPALCCQDYLCLSTFGNHFALCLFLTHCGCHFAERLGPGLATLSSGTFWFVYNLNSPVIKMQAIFWDAVRC